MYKIHTNLPKWIHMNTNPYKSIKMYINLYKSIQIHQNIYKCTQIHTIHENVYKCIQIHINPPKCIQTYTYPYKSTKTYTNVYNSYKIAKLYTFYTNTCISTWKFSNSTFKKVSLDNRMLRVLLSFHQKKRRTSNIRISRCTCKHKHTVKYEELIHDVHM